MRCWRYVPFFWMFSRNSWTRAETSSCISWRDSQAGSWSSNPFHCIQSWMLLSCILMSRIFSTTQYSPFWDASCCRQSVGISKSLFRKNLGRVPCTVDLLSDWRFSILYRKSDKTAVTRKGPLYLKESFFVLDLSLQPRKTNSPTSKLQFRTCVRELCLFTLSSFLLLALILTSRCIWSNALRRTSIFSICKDRASPMSIISTFSKRSNFRIFSGLWDGSPVKKVIDARPPRRQREVQFRIDCTSRSSDEQSLNGKCSSEETARRTRRSSLQTTSAVRLFKDSRRE